MPQIEVIVNAGSGSVLEGETGKTLTERFIALGVRANVHLAKSGCEAEFRNRTPNTIKSDL